MRVLPGNIQPQVPAVSGAKSLKNPLQKASSVSKGQAAASGRQSRSGQPFHGRGRVSYFGRSQKQGVKPNAQVPLRAKNSKKRRAIPSSKPSFFFLISWWSIPLQREIFLHPDRSFPPPSQAEDPEPLDIGTPPLPSP